LEAGVTYTLDVYVGRRTDNISPYSWPTGVEVGLYVGGTELASSGAISDPGLGLWRFVEVSYVAPSNGGPLRIQLTSNGVQADFDLVSLRDDKVPLPSGVLLLGSGLLGLVGWRRFKKS
jgi:hypothetical protein